MVPGILVSSVSLFHGLTTFGRVDGINGLPEAGLAKRIPYTRMRRVKDRLQDKAMALRVATIRPVEHAQHLPTLDDFIFEAVLWSMHGRLFRRRPDI